MTALAADREVEVSIGAGEWRSGGGGMPATDCQPSGQTDGDPGGAHGGQHTLGLADQIFEWLLTVRAHGFNPSRTETACCGNIPLASGRRRCGRCCCWPL